MRMILTTATLLALVTTAYADEYVSGYTRSNGTYVNGYTRSSRDSSYNNNYSTSPNINPYTGSRGTNSPTYNDRTPDYNRSTYGTSGTYNSGSYGSSYRNSYGSSGRSYYRGY